MAETWRYESLFSYNITRPYPFRWFTPVVVVGTLVGLVVFTLINLITQGLQIVTVSTTDPSTLVTSWEATLPTFLTKRTRPTCSPVQIPVGSQIYSDKKGLAYRLAAINQRIDGSPWNIQSALQYSNDPIDNCTVTALSVSLDGKSRSPQERAWMEWGPQARAFIQCDISIAQDPIFPSTLNINNQVVRVNLTTIYDYVPEDIAYGPWRIVGGGESNPNSNGLSSLVVEDGSQDLSLYWAASLLSMYWTQTSARMTNATEQLVSLTSNATGNAASQLSSGIVYFRRNSNIHDIRDLGFFDVDYRVFFDQVNGDLDMSFAQPNDTVSSLAATNAMPNIWIPTDSLAKSLWSTIMTDLGDVSQEQVIVGDEALTTYFTSNFSQILTELNQTRFASARPGPSQQSFASPGNPTGSLSLTRSVIDTQYLCQVPQWKNGGEIFILVLAQNIVFLSSVWAGWKLLVGLLLLRPERMGRDINYCDGHVDGAKARSKELVPGQQPMESSGLMSRRWQRQEQGVYDHGSGYTAVVASSPPPPVSRFSKDFKSMAQTQVAEGRG